MSQPKDHCDNLDQRIRDGELDEGLFEAVAECLGADVQRFARSRCGDLGGDAEDITQDAMLAAQRYLSSFRGDASLRTWLYRLVISACSRRRRGRKNDPSLHRSMDADNAPEVATPPAEAADPEVQLMMGEKLDALRAAIDGLRDTDRELLSLVEWQGLSLAEVGQRKEISVSAVKSRMFRIRQQLRERVLARFDEPHSG